MFTNTAKTFHRAWAKALREGDETPPAGTPPAIIPAEVVIEVDPATGKQVYKLANGERLLTQSQFNHAMSTTKKDSRDKESLISQLQEMQQRASTSEDMRATLQSEIESLQATFLTKEQQYEQKIKTLETESERRIRTAEEARKQAEQRWEDREITTALLESATKNKAKRSDQLVKYLRQDTKLVPITDNTGKPTGTYEVHVQFEDRDADDKPIYSTLPAAEAIKRMRDLDIHQNLFEIDQRPGVQGNNNGTKPDLSKIDLSKLTMEQFKDMQSKGLLGQLTARR